VFEHMHNKIVHFPIPLGLSAAVILLGRERWAVDQPLAGALLAVAVVFASPPISRAEPRPRPSWGRPPRPS
jgi:hypothetical protein